MKKQIMFMAMTAMLIASCSSDDVVSTNTGRAIDFRTSVGTRGAETTTANISKFILEFCLFSFCNTKISENSDMAKSWATFCCSGTYK
ncbi:MAG: fimbrillin family protein [Prevotella sp.]|nr:fimbrillin family protein [Prevotellaceae bacterium]MDY5344295.1 fimbrillin family protein [Prevotella sp.]